MEEEADDDDDDDGRMEKAKAVGTPINPTNRARNRRLDCFIMQVGAKETVVVSGVSFKKDEAKLSTKMIDRSCSWRKMGLEGDPDSLKPSSSNDRSRKNRRCDGGNRTKEWPPYSVTAGAAG